ncbi:MAG TPA: LptF/LptG family permease [bacterium]|nr:LptF/LptG family permease [bacterium]
MKTIHAYVLKEMFPSFLLSVSLLTLLFMVNKVFLYLDLVLSNKVSLGQTLFLYLSLLPFILSLTIPMAMMVGTLLSFGRLSSDMEVTAFKSGGGHLFHLIAPILFLGVGMTALMLFFNDRIMPEAKFFFKKTEFDIVRNKADVAIRENVFIDQFEGHQFIIGRKDPSGTLSDIKVFDHWAPGATVQTTLARTGSVSTDQKNYQVFFDLRDGVMSWANSNFHTYNRLFFDRYTIRLKLEGRIPGSNDLKKDYEEMDLPEIRRSIGTETDPERIDHLRAEFQKRLALPFACLILPWFCAPLGLWLRSKGFMGFVLGLILIFLYYLMFIFGQTMSNEGRLSPFLGLWGANLVLGAGGFLVYFLAVTERPLFRRRATGKQ